MLWRFRISAIILAFTAAVFAVVSDSSAQTPPASGELRRTQEQNAKVYRELSRGLLSLAQKLERSDRPEDKERAKTIRSALDIAEKSNIDNQFQTLIMGLGRGASQPGEVQKLIGQNSDLQKSLLEMLNILMTDDETTRLKTEIEKLEKFLKEAEEIKRKQEILRAMTESSKGDPNKLAKNQADIAEQTKELARRMSTEKNGENKTGKKDSSQKGGDGQAQAKPDPKSDPKNDAKPGDNPAENKPDPAESKAGGDSKDAKSKGGEPKDGDKNQKSNDSKGSDPKGGEPKGGEPKGGEPKGGEPKGGEPKGGEPKGGEPKGGEPKGGEPKGGDKKPDSQEKPSAENAKPPKAESKPSQGQQNAGDAKSKDSPKGEQKQAQAKNAGQQGEPGEPGQPPGQPGQQPQEQAQEDQQPGRKKVQEAYPHQKAAEDELKKNQRDEAAKKEDQAIEKLSKAIEELKKKLKQLREEEILKTLAALEARCNRMLALQVEVYDSTKLIHSVIVKNNNQKTVADVQKSQQQADKENEIITEADKALKLLASEGSAVAFARVLEEVRGDMQSIQRRLFDARVDIETQSIEENVIAMLKNMVAALKKAQQDIQNQQQQPPPPGQQKKQPDNKKLIDLLAELRLIRAMQMQVNDRTKLYADRYPGEQTNDPILQAEFRQLAQRQAKLQDMIHKIVTGANQ